jgi:hypothetical protein
MGSAAFDPGVLRSAAPADGRCAIVLTAERVLGIEYEHTAFDRRSQHSQSSLLSGFAVDRVRFVAAPI